MSYEVTEAHRRIANIVQVGVVAETDYVNDRYRVEIGDLLTGWLPHVQLRGAGNLSYSTFDEGEQVVVIAPSGELAAAFIVGSLHTELAPIPVDRGNVHRIVYADGTVLEYNRATHHLTAILADGSATITAPNGITINGDVTVNGDVVASGISLVHHVHDGVMFGGSETGEPVA